jgi:hypothetical protein
LDGCAPEFNLFALFNANFIGNVIAVPQRNRYDNDRDGEKEDFPTLLIAVQVHFTNILV